MRAGADQRNEVGSGDRAPTGLGGLDQLEHHREWPIAPSPTTGSGSRMPRRRQSRSKSAHDSVDSRSPSAAIVICHLGCALREWLIISGSHRGTIWSDGRADDVDLVPLLCDDGKPVTFARWYTDWLAKAECTVLRAPSDA